MNLLSSNSLNPQLTLWLIAFSPLTLMLAGCAESNADSDPNSPGLTGSIEINGSSTGLCIAHALAVEPEVILMEEPAFALDRIATFAIEELIRELRQDYSIVIVTHNMQQAALVFEETAFLMVGDDRGGLPGRAWRHQRDIHHPQRRANRTLYHRQVQLSIHRTQAERKY